jgi:hypothetical protein
MSNRFAALQNLNDEVVINRAWDTIRGNIKISAKGRLGCYELKVHNPWFDEGCSKLLETSINCYKILENKQNCNGYNMQAK